MERLPAFFFRITIITTITATITSTTSTITIAIMMLLSSSVAPMPLPENDGSRVVEASEVVVTITRPSNVVVVAVVVDVVVVVVVVVDVVAADVVSTDVVVSTFAALVLVVTLAELRVVAAALVDDERAAAVDVELWLVAVVAPDDAVDASDASTEVLCGAMVVGCKTKPSRANWKEYSARRLRSLVDEADVNTNSNVVTYPACK